MVSRQSDSWMYILAHLSDPHLALPKPGARQLVSKRFTGYLSWQMKRRHIHVPRSLQAVAHDILAQHPDHIALTGDIANISLPQEFEQAQAWLQGFAPPDRLSIVPGNHDYYVEVPWQQSLGRLAAYMQGDETPPPRSPEDFPFVRRRGEVVLIGLSTAVPTPPLIARGGLGEGQLARLDTILATLAADRHLCRILLIHHPPHIGGAPWRKGLADGAALRRLLKDHGVDLVLHGHNHRNEIGRIVGPDGAIPVVGVISASAAPDSPYGRGGWNRITVQRDTNGWRFEIMHRCVDDAAQSCSDCQGYEILGPARHDGPVPLRSPAASPPSVIAPPP